MAKELKQVVNQYDVEGVPVRCIVQFVDTETGKEEQTIINREDMQNPNSNIFDNYKTMVGMFMVNSKKK